MSNCLVCLAYMRSTYVEWTGKTRNTNSYWKILAEKHFSSYSLVSLIILLSKI